MFESTEDPALEKEVEVILEYVSEFKEFEDSKGQQFSLISIEDLFSSIICEENSFKN